MKKIDLHVHTSESDGTFAPAEVVRLAAEAGLSAIAITDHDTNLGYREAAEAADKYGIEVVPGIEISTKYTVSVHILGYYIDGSSPALKEVLDWVVTDRDARNRRMAELMAADGLPVSYDEMLERFGSVIGRPHFGHILIELGLAENMQDAFDRYIEKGRRYYLPRTIMPIKRSIELIREAGGIPVLAHPFQYRYDDAMLRELIEYCMDFGLCGMECRYSGYGEDRVEYLSKLADEYGLVKTGGSDFHGEHKTVRLGSGYNGELEVPYECLERLRELKKC